MNCNHEFIGTVSGVQCKKCELSMTAEQYRKYLNPEPEQVKTPKKRTTRKAVKV